jgi:hypothetical protein
MRTIESIRVASRRCWEEGNEEFSMGVLLTLVALAFGDLASLLLGFAEVRAEKAPGRWETARMLFVGVALGPALLGYAFSDSVSHPDRNAAQFAA